MWLEGFSKMQKIVICILLIFVGLSGCAPKVPNQPIITFTPSNGTVPAPVITPSDNIINANPARSITKSPATPPPWANVSAYTDNSRVIITGVNQEFAIGLDFKPPLPYSWIPTFSENWILVDTYFVPNPPPSPPINATQWFLFKVLTPGKIKIAFSYVDPTSAIAPMPVLNQKEFIIEIK